MIKTNYQKVEEISVKDWNSIFNSGEYTIQPLIFGYKLQIKNSELLYKHQKVSLVNRLLNKYVDKLYIESSKIKDVIKNCFIIYVDGKIFVDDVENNMNFDGILLKCGYIPVHRYKLKSTTFTTYDEIKSYLYKSSGMSDDLRDTIFGFKIVSKDKNTVISIKIEEKEKEKFVVDDAYKFYYNFATNFVSQEFQKYPLKYHNNIKNSDERVIWLAVRLAVKLSMLELTFKDAYLKPVIKPFENNINYDKIPTHITENGLSSIFMIILSILYNKTIKSGFLKSDLEQTHKHVQDFIDESYCEHMYFVDNYYVSEKLN